MSFATDEEIKIAHNILLGERNPFDDNRIDIIKNDNSCYVQASPGSGKTTALLAKLIILANRMPLPDGKGVCVLTHTNVAINEIKAKLGQKADILFSYPNFFGTIQSFLHKYVTDAALNYFYGSQITYVDNDVAQVGLLKKYNRLSFENKLKKLIYARTISKEYLIEADEINKLGGVEVLTAAKVIEKKGKRAIKYHFKLKDYDLTNIPKDIKTLIYNKKNKIIDNYGKQIFLSFRIDWLNNRIITDQLPIGMTTEAGAEFVKIKEELFSEGIMSFEDAYDLAFRYIREKKLDFSNFSDKRFKYLFIDEIQDCDQKQIELIKNIFADNKVIIQRFGDYCQAIFDGDGSNGTENEELKGQNILYIHDSKRFGENIAKPLRTLCSEDNHELVGNGDVPSVKPIIITYDNPLEVIPKYAELLRSTLIPEKNNLSVLEIANQEKKEDPLHRVNIKACGWVGKAAINDRRFIQSYFPAYKRTNEKIKTEGDSFDDFILKDPYATVKDYASLIIQGILKFLDLCEIKNGTRRYTKTSLFEFLTLSDLEQKESFTNNIMRWSMLVVKGNNENIRDVKTSIYQYLISVLLPLFGKDVTEEANSFFNTIGEKVQMDQVNDLGNIYRVDNIDIEVATVHAVKGETHASTLYLETSYYGLYESERLAEQFKGESYKGTDDKTLRSLKVIYVGASRPRYLLCVAIEKDRFDKIDSPELREIWDVVNS